MESARNPDGDAAASLVEPAAKFEEVQIPLREPVHGLDCVSGVIGIPEWWPTGSRVAVAIAHGSTLGLKDPLLEHLQTQLTEYKCLTIRFNFPFAEAGKRAAADSPAVLEATYRNAIGMLARDPSAAPAHLFLGGKGLGARVASQIAAGRVRVDGAFFLGYPLHAQDKPEQMKPESLYRIISPMLFVQGTRDRTCDLGALRQALGRIGAPTTTHLVEEADQNFKTPKRVLKSDEEVYAEILERVSTWVDQVLRGG